MSIGSLGPVEKAKIQNIINEGVQVLADIAALKEGLKETVDAIAEELDIKKTVISKAIRVAHKMSENRDSLTEDREELDDVEELLIHAGKVST